MRRVDLSRLALTVSLLVLAVVWLMPSVWVVVTSLKVTAEIVKVPPEWIPWPMTGAHYHEVLLGSSRTARMPLSAALAVAMKEWLTVTTSSAGPTPSAVSAR